MDIYCKYPDCKEPPVLHVKTERGIVVYFIDVCMDHGDWASEYLKEHVPEE